MNKTECKCPFPKDETKITKNLWKEGESKYKWNRAGTLKDYSYNCEECGKEQHFMPVWKDPGKYVEVHVVGSLPKRYYDDKPDSGTILKTLRAFSKTKLA